MFVASVAAVVGTLGASALATHAYASQNHAVLLAGLAAEIVVGHLIGAGALHAAHRLVRRALAVGLALGIGVATAAALAGPSLLGAYTNQRRQHLGLGLVGMWIAYAADEWLRGLLMWRRWAGLGRVPHARAAQRRLHNSAGRARSEATVSQTMTARADAA